MVPPATRRLPWRPLLGVAITLAVLTPLGWMWRASLVPDTYSMMELGYADYGTGQQGGAEPPAGHSNGHEAAGHGTGNGQPVDPVSVDALTGPQHRRPDVRETLVAREEPIEIGSDRSLDGLTLNHRSPGPTISAERGELVEVRLANESVTDGVTVHWHGLDLPNAEDGVAGVTQDAVPVGGEHVYRFVADRAGTFWYHSHQHSHEQVPKGLFGALVVTPPGGLDVVDVVAAVHTYDGIRTIGGQPGERQSNVEPGSRVRVRVINTDNGLMQAWVSGAEFRVVAVDGVDLVEPEPLSDVALDVPAGGRVDLELTTPTDGSPVRVDMGGSSALVLGPDGASAPATAVPTDVLDLMSYGAVAPVQLDPAEADVHFEYNIGRRPGFLDGKPGFWWSINGHTSPDLPMFVVSAGDLVRVTLDNDSGEAHPMHLHGHHALVLSRNGQPSTGSPLWVDSLNVDDGDSYDLAFMADNPGVWMFHCHDLPHAVEGLVTHLVYSGVTEPFVVGGAAGNQPE